MNKFESGPAGGKKETKFDAMIRKLKEEGYEFDTVDSESVFTIKVPNKEIGVTKISGVETEDGWKSFDDVVKDSIVENAPKKEQSPEDPKDTSEQ